MRDQGRAAGGSLVVQTTLGRRGWWVIVPLEVAGAVTIEMVLDTGSFLSGISEGTREMLVRLGLLEADATPPYVLRNVAVQGQPLTDLRVRLSRRVAQVGAQGVLGLDFLGQFTDIHFHVPTMRLTLSR